MEKIITGRVWKFGNNIDTDVIYPGKYLPIIEAEEMAKHALEGIDPEFPQKLQKNDILVAGSNFGCGSSREQAATSLKYAGVGCIIAKSFSRIFFRNAINQGLPLVQSKECLELVNQGDIISVDFSQGKIKLPDRELDFPPLPPGVFEILEAGGLIESVRKKIQHQDT
ncbi:MAG: 3-isopropylmalate dehydratase small subunit [candidate division KSB1 bacterium]|nr:3-isopropylmalate dehydratase small subunit [candidate division KSB1 bacterium]